MGFLTEFNWALKLKPENGLDESMLKAGKEYSFSKEGCRIYPVNIPIDLINKDWGPVAKVAVTELNSSQAQTSGKYRVLKIYKGKERDVLTDYWQENSRLMNGK